MKPNLILAFVIAATILVSCRKEPSFPCGKSQCDPVTRKVRFELYTNENFSGYEGNITFRLFMRDNSRIIFDSSLAKMKVKDIPDFKNRMIMEKSVPGNNASALVVGFVYYLENIGESWHLKDFPAGSNYKIVSFPFK